MIFIKMNKKNLFYSLIIVMIILIYLNRAFSEGRYSINFLMGRFYPAKHPGFIKISKKHTTRKNIYLHKDAYRAFGKMARKARSQGIKLMILSGTRNFFHQKNIWEAKWTGRRKVKGINLKKKILNGYERALVILRYSSMPGTSRHHWGTDLDLNSFENSYFETGYGKKVFLWLKKNAPKFGFCMPYSKKNKRRPFGYEMEKWHWSYKPMAQKILKRYNKLIDNRDIRGFLGAGTVKKNKIIGRYVNGISPECK